MACHPERGFEGGREGLVAAQKPACLTLVMSALDQAVVEPEPRAVQ